MSSVVMMPVHIRYNPRVIEKKRLRDLSRSIRDEVAITLRSEVPNLHREWLVVMFDRVRPGDSSGFDFIVEIDTGLPPDRAPAMKSMIAQLERVLTLLFRDESVNFCLWLKFAPMLCTFGEDD